jgi:4-hydroxybenzoyl-CoA thioesterase/acyl-CoA thioester hydrolase
MNNAFTMKRQVEFMDTDMAGIVHFTAYFRYMETAEHALFRSLGLSITTQEGKRRLGWPRVSCGFDFLHTLHFDDEFEVRLGVVRINRSSVTYQAEIVREEKVIARGHSTSVYCEISPASEMQAQDVPGDIVAKLNQFLLPENPDVENSSRDEREECK